MKLPGSGVPLAFVRQYYDDPVAHDLWPFYVDRNGYGELATGRMHTSPHALACEWAHGPKPTSEHQVAHSCRNHHCYYAGHLRWATSAEDAQDRLAAGTVHRGEGASWAKLTQHQVIEIRLRYLTAENTQQELAEEYGVNHTTVWKIVHGKRWVHVWENLHVLDEVA